MATKVVSGGKGLKACKVVWSRLCQPLSLNSVPAPREGKPTFPGALYAGLGQSSLLHNPCLSSPTPGSGSELKQNCTPTQDTVCHCKPGTQPRGDGYKRGVGELHGDLWTGVCVCLCMVSVCEVVRVCML